MGDWQVIIDAAKAINAAAENGGAIAAIATAALFGVRVLRLRLVQDWLPIGLQWGAWPAALKWALPFVLAAVGTLALDLQAGTGILGALTAAFAAGVAAVSGHHATRAMGEAEQRAQLARNPLYRPGALRRAAGLVLPVKKAGAYARVVG